MVITDVRESRMFITYGLAYLPGRCPNDEEMDLYSKPIFTPAIQWNPSDLDDDDQWEDYDDDVSSGANVSATSYNQSNDLLEPILSAPQYKDPSATFTDNVAFTKGTNEN